MSGNDYQFVVITCAALALGWWLRGRLLQPHRPWTPPPELGACVDGVNNAQNPIRGRVVEVTYRLDDEVILGIELEDGGWAYSRPRLVQIEQTGNGYHQEGT